MEFSKLIWLSDTHVQMLISLFSHYFTLGEISCNVFNSVLDNTDDSRDKIKHNKEVLCEEDINPFIEWLLITVSKHTIGDNEPVLIKLQHNA